MVLKALIFDVDGTLAETEEQHRHAFNATFEDYGANRIWPDPARVQHWPTPQFLSERNTAYFLRYGLECNTSSSGRDCDRQFPAADDLVRSWVVVVS